MSPDPDERVLDAAIALASRRLGVDLRDYRRETLAQRLGDAARAGGDDTPERLLRRAEADPETADRLARAFLVGATGFFRDPEVFAALEGSVLPALLETRTVLRAWVAGASTGEEAWSLAMCLAAAVARAPGAEFAVIATDLAPASLRTAERGVYSGESARDVPAAHRARFLEEEGRGARIVEALRSRVVFAPHDLVGPTLAPKAAVLASFDVVMCRNVLIYFDARLQEKAGARLAGVTSPGGALVVGGAEGGAGGPSPLVAPWPGLSLSLGIFRRREAP